MKASIDSIETLGLVDGPGIRTVIFFNKCNLRCKYCHNPETWIVKDKNYSQEYLIERILKNKNYFKNNGGVTFSGGEPLLQYDFLLEICKKLKKENIHIALDTAGVGNGNYIELLQNIDLVLLDIKHITKEGFTNITQTDNYDKFIEFINQLNKTNTDVWIRQVIIPDVNDNEIYTKELAKFIKSNINNVKKIEFLPFHTLGNEKYKKRNIKNPYQDKKDMDKNKCNKLYELFIKEYNK